MSDMKAVILAGGLGTRLSEETVLRPKPMVEIGGRPLLWHIMKIYSKHGINDFIICCGYKGYVIKDFFSNYELHMSDITIDLRNSEIQVHQKRAEPWKITLVDTGDESMTGGRLKRVRRYLDDEHAFCLTYGDGVGNVDIADTIMFHASHGKLATMTATYPPGRFGSISIDKNSNLITKFIEKPEGDGGLINAGFFVLSPKVIDYIQDDRTIWEQDPLKNLAKDSQLVAYRHDGFWQPMDTVRDKTNLEELWSSGNAPWKIWDS